MPRRDGGLLDLRPINRALHRRMFRMMTLKQTLAQIHLQDCFASIDLKDVYFHIRIATCHGLSSRVVFEGTACGYSVLPFGLALAPHMFSVSRYNDFHS